MKHLKLFLAAIIVFGVSSCEVITPSSISFTTTSDSGLEGTNYAIGITIDLPLDAETTINYTVSGTAGASDFSLPSSVTIPSGSTSGALDLQVFDNTDYDNIGKTVIVTITDVTGSDNITLGTNLIFTYTILENDLEIVLSWQPSSGVAGDHDLDLFLDDESFFNIDLSICGSSCITEEIVMTQDYVDMSYIVHVQYFSGSIGSSQPNLTVNYTVTINFPDGTVASNSDVYSLNNRSSRNLYRITKNGDGNFSATADPFGAGGRHAPHGSLVKTN